MTNPTISSSELIEQRNRRLQERGENDLRAILKLPEGRRLVWSMLEEGRVFQSSFTGNSETFFNEGKRAVGLVLLGRILAVKPEAFQQMTLEHASEEKDFAEQVEKAKREEERNG